jgi:hypothetical protein
MIIDLVTVATDGRNALAMFGHPKELGWVFAILASCLLAMCVDDLLTYRPLILQDGHYDSPGFEFLEHVAKSDRTLDALLYELQGQPPKSNKGAIEYELRMYERMWNAILNCDIRYQITFQFIRLIVSVIFSLSLLIYFANNAAAGGLLTGVAKPLPLFSHLYFVVVTFFTIGYGDIHPATGNVIGEMCSLLIALASMLSIYVGLSVFLGGMQSMRDGVRSAVRSYIVARSTL